ncbi:MAG TPA: MMPL family transporter, partial [Kofleriaceae bacterium]|nr:MMPL family transporter [Kofleriaceae bacterium]
MTWGEKTIDLLHKHARWLVPLVLLVTFGAGIAARSIRVDNSLRVWFVEGDSALVAYDEYKQAFGNDETVVVAAVAPEGIYDPRALERIRAASRRFEEHPKVRRVTSIALGLHVSGGEGFLEVERLLGDGPITPADAAALRAKIAANPFFRGTVVGDSDKITLILVDPKSSPDFDRERAGLLRDLRAIAHEELDKDGGSVHLGGIGVVYEGLNEASMRDTAIFVTLSYVIIFIGLWLMFRRLIWVALGALVVTAAIVGTLGVAGLAGRDMNMVTAVLPTLLMTIGILDLIHIVDAYEEGVAANPKVARRRLLAVSLGVVVVPCIFNTFTDVIGFASLVSARMSAVRDLGWLSSVGLLLLLVIILVVVVPAVARFGGRRKLSLGRLAEGAHVEPVDEEAQGWMRGLVLRLYAVAAHHRLAVYGVSLALAAASVVGILRIDVDTYTVGFLAPDDPVRRDHEAIEQEFGPYIPLEMRVSTPAEGGLKEPALLRQVAAMERAFEKQPGVGRTTGLPEVVQRVNQVWNDDA